MALTRPLGTTLAPRAGAPGRDVRAAEPAPSQGTLVTAATHIRRCTFRRVTAVAKRRELPMYDVDCLHPVYESALRLGDLAAAYDACAACTLPGIFRPDED